MLWDPEERLKIQPAFVLAGLAMAELMRSSDAERGADGRTRAAWLRENAQSALSIAMSGGSGWVNYFRHAPQSNLILSISQNRSTPPLQKPLW